LAFVAGIGHFAKHFPTSASSFIDPTTHEATHDVWVWAYAAGFVVMVIVSTVVQLKTTVDRNKTKKEEQYKNSLLYAAPTTNVGNRSVYVDHVSGYNTAV
jgi:prolipoprotein diacylglyceryltransferase